MAISDDKSDAMAISDELAVAISMTISDDQAFAATNKR